MKKVLLALSLLSASLTAQVTTAANPSMRETKPGVAQTSRPLQPNEHPLNLPGTTTIDAPPADFDPLNASDQELLSWGFPPPPDRNAEPARFERWKKMVTTPAKRIVPVLQQTSVFHGPAQRAKTVTVESDLSAPGGPVMNTAASINWSGYVTFPGTSTISGIQGEMTVPHALHPHNTCAGGWFYGSAWEGIDGWLSPDVLQAGVEFDSYCLGTLTAGQNYAWYEWYPNAAVQITNFPVNPGDDVYVEVFPSSPTKGQVWMLNNNTAQIATFTFNAPAGTSLVGDSAEWAIERPLVGGSLSTLTDFTSAFFWNAASGTKAGTGLTVSSSSTIPVNMGVNGVLAAFPEMIGNESFVVHTTGPAQ